MGKRASIVIPTYNRPEELARCEESLSKQTCQDFEVIRLIERGELAHLRNEGLWRATAPVVCFIDDDTVCPTTWLEAILGIFERNSSVLAGVSGPAITPTELRSQRDLLSDNWRSTIYRKCFLDKHQLPGHLSRAGAAGLSATQDNCVYEGNVEYLEACNMSFRTEVLKTIGGFDETYAGIGDWSEPDVCARLRSQGYSCYFSPACRLYHLPSRTGAFAFRATSGARYRNYVQFARRWVKPCLRHYAFRSALKTYYLLNDLQTWWNRCGH